MTPDEIPDPDQPPPATPGGGGAGGEDPLAAYKALQQQLAELLGAKWDDTAKKDFEMLWQMHRNPADIVDLFKRGYRGGSLPNDPATGQPKPPAGGWPTYPSRNMVGGGGGNGFDPSTMGDLLAPFTEQFQAPDPVWSWEDAPEFHAPTYTAPDPFSYPDFQKPADFVAPSAEEALNDPGYKFRLDQGEKALLNSKLAQGTGRTGGTMKEMLDYGQKAASSEYQNVYGRKKGEYDTSVANDLTAWGTNYRKSADTWAANTKEGLDAYDRLFQGAMEEFGPKMTSWQTKTQWGPQQNQQNYQNAWQQYLGRENTFRQNERWPWEVLRDSASTGAAGL